MRTHVLLLSVLFSMLVTSPAVAQSGHAASQSALDTAVQRHISSTDGDRALVERLLERPDVQAVAQGAGIDIRTAATALGTMDAGTLSGLASQARSVEQALAGGQSRVTINTTLLIIGLLVLILLIVALK